MRRRNDNFSDHNVTSSRYASLSYSSTSEDHGYLERLPNTSAKMSVENFIRLKNSLASRKMKLT